MATAHYITTDGTIRTVHIPTGTSLMAAAVSHGIGGILGDCGGVMSCATCHVYVQAPHDTLLPGPSTEESLMLDFTAAPRERTSRLACQLVMSPAIDGISVRIAQPQA